MFELEPRNDVPWSVIAICTLLTIDGLFFAVVGMLTILDNLYFKGSLLLVLGVANVFVGLAVLARKVM